MNTDFRILSENTFNLKGGKLYVMLLRDNDNYGVEVVDREKTFGRKMTESRKQAEFLFDSVTERLSRYKNLKDAVFAIEKCFAFKSLDKLLFVLIMDDKVCSQADIVAMKGKFKFKTRLKFGYNKNVKDKDSLTVYIYENQTAKKPYGVLFGSADSKNMKFELL